MQRAGPTLVLSGRGRELSGLVAILSRPTGVGGCEYKTFGYTCRTGALTIFGQGFNSPRLHQREPTRPGATLMVPGRRADHPKVRFRSLPFNSDPLISLRDVIGVPDASSGYERSGSIGN